MAVARHGPGIRVTVGAVASQIHPVFMLPPLAATWFGAMLASVSSLSVGIVHSVAIFTAVYTAHVKDGYVDFYVRGEDADHPLTTAGCRMCLGSATALFAGAILVLWVSVGWIAAILTAPTWVIAYLHAPHLDMHPLGVTLGYPVGIGLSLLGGYYVQADTVTAIPVAFAIVFVVLLAGVKIVDDTQDYEYDRRIGKSTVAVLIGRRRARTLSTVLLTGAGALVLVFVAVGSFPVGSVLAAVALWTIVLLTRSYEPVSATALLIRGSYVVFGVFIGVVWVETL